jgi:hypothetical protein
LAFSGEGIRSPHFASEFSTLCKTSDICRRLTISAPYQMDVVAGWMLGHSGQDLDDIYATVVQTLAPSQMARPHGDFVTHLRHDAGLSEKGARGPASYSLP